VTTTANFVVFRRGNPARPESTYSRLISRAHGLNQPAERKVAHSAYTCVAVSFGDDTSAGPNAVHCAGSRLPRPAATSQSQLIFGFVPGVDMPIGVSLGDGDEK